MEEGVQTTSKFASTKGSKDNKNQTSAQKKQELLKTIQLPKNLKNLGKNLPKATYEEDEIALSSFKKSVESPIQIKNDKKKAKEMAKENQENSLALNGQNVLEI